MYQVRFPPGFRPKDFVEPGMVPSGDFSWFFVGYGAFPGQPVRCHVFRTTGKGALATLVPIEKPTSGRGSLSIGAAGHALWLHSYEGDQLLEQVVPGWVTPLWMTR